MPKKCDFEKWDVKLVKQKKIGFAFSTLVKWWKWKMLHRGNNATLCMNVTRHDVAVSRGTVHKELLTA